MFNPSLYVKQNNLQRRDAALVLQDLIHRMSWNQEENILDVGCGPGDVTVSVLSNYLPDDVTIVRIQALHNCIATICTCNEFKYQVQYKFFYGIQPVSAFKLIVELRVRRHQTRRCLIIIIPNAFADINLPNLRL